MGRPKKIKTEKAIAKNETAIVKAPSQFVSIPQTETGQLLQMAVDKNLDVDKLEKLIELKHREEERAAKIDFDMHFAEMQRDFPSVSKSKSVKDNENKVLYKYCPLSVLDRVFGPVIRRHGFSYRFGSRAGKDKEVQPFCVVSGWGHEIETTVDIPVAKLTRATNIIQEHGAALSYGYRYAFVAAFGIVIAGEDDEANFPKDPIKDPRPVSETSAPSIDPKLQEAREKVKAKYVKLMESGLFVKEPLLKDSERCRDSIDDLETLCTKWDDDLQTRRNN